MEFSNNMNRKIHQLYKWSAMINIAVAITAAIRIIAQYVLAECFYLSLPWQDEILVVCILVISVCTPIGIGHWRKYKKETEKKAFAIMGIIFGLYMFAVGLFPPIFILAILASPFIGIWYWRKNIYNAKQTFAALLGAIFGIFVLILGGISTGGGHNFILFYLFTSPIGGFIKFTTPVILFLVPVWWAAMFSITANPTDKTLSWSLFLIGECIHFGTAIYCLASLSAEEWSVYIRWSDDLPVILMVSLIYIPPYLLGHIYMILLLQRKSTYSELKNNE